MSGPAAAGSLEAHFDAIRCSEVARLKKKLSAFDEEQRSVAEAIVADVVRELAARAARVLREQDAPRLVEAAVRLFDIPAPER